MATTTPSKVPVFQALPLDCVRKRESSWLQVVSHLSPQHGGIATSVPRLARATEAASNHSCPIVGFCHQSEVAHVSQSMRDTVTVFPPDRMRWVIDRGLRQSLRRTVRAAAGVHIHGVWETHCMVASGIARQCKTPYVISVHGMLEDWALRHKRVKKALYAALTEIRTMQNAACLRALSGDEVSDYRRLGLTNPIAIVPNGVDIPPVVSAELFLSQYPELAGKRILLFLGRLHEKKGIPLLLQACSNLVQKSSDIHVVIAGPNSDQVLPSLETLTEQLKMKPFVTFTGMLAGELKWSALAAASVFVLPSHSEGLSMAILEALASGIPVIATTACHMPEIASHNCGWIASPTAESLGMALEQFVALPPGELKQFGERGRSLVQKQFGSSIVGAQIAEVYDWLQGGSRPSTVEIV